MLVLFYSLMILLGLIVLAVVFLLIPWFLLREIVVYNLGTAPPLISGARVPRHGGECCEFETKDGLTLQGTYFATSAAERVGVIAYCHELNGDRWAAFEYVEDLLASGFDVFTFDFRSHGFSDSHAGYKPLPWLTYHELSDIKAAVDYLCSREDTDARGIGLLGVSRGAAAALCIAGDDERVRAVVSDGAIATATMHIHFIRRFVRIYTRLGVVLARLPNWILGIVGARSRAILQRRMSCQFVKIEQFARRVHQPVLMIHGQNDHYVPLDVTVALRGYLAGRSRLWVVPNAKHNMAITVATEEYHRRIRRFFLRHLAGGSALEHSTNDPEPVRASTAVV